MPVDPLVSVVLPVFNAEKYIAEAVESVLAQTFIDLELIVVDDGSTDLTPAILEMFCLRDSRIRVLSGPNVGYTRALIKAIAVSSGEFIARMDADDVCFPNRLEKQIHHLKTHQGCVALGSALLVIDSDGAPVSIRNYPLRHEDIDSAHIAGLGGHLAHPATIYRRESYDKIGGYRPEYEPAEDLDLWVRLAEIGKLENLPEALLKYRVHQKSATSIRRRIMIENTLRITREACLRRGIDPPNHRPGTSKLMLENNACNYSRGLSCIAWEFGFYRTSRKHARLQLRLAPLSLSSWKYFIRSYLGPLSRPLVRIGLALRRA